MAVISIDAMGGDHGCRTTVAATVNALRANPDISFVLVGDETELTFELNRCGWQANSRLEIKPTSETVAMDDPPAQALRSKKDSSMRVAIDLVKSGRVQACVSAGNTGALMAMARFVLRTLPGIDRPAIVSPLPSQSGETLVLDLGANIDSSAENLFQFALMGSALSTALFDIQSPRVGLLNVGVEEIKGSDIVKQAAALVAASELNYVGFVEGNDIFLGDVDVVACDGFVGNIALKSSEGLAKLLMGFLRSGFERNLLSKIAGFIASPVLRRLKSDLDPRHYNGASFLGLNGIVVKSHGDADVLGFEHAIHTAWLEIQNRVPEQISLLLQSRESGNKVQEG